LKFLQVAEAIAAPLRQMIYGAMLVVFMRFRPQGLLPEYKSRKG
jgi:ABC-type branched-subunit amino acid transport system permease subunit